VLYVQKGWKESAEVLGTTVEGDFRINYLEVPVLARFSLGAVVKPYLAIGPYLATRQTTSAKFSAGGVSVEGNLDEWVKKSDAGMIIGAGVQTPVKLSFEARYSYGLGTIDDSGENLDIKNSALSLLIGYALF
jgi:opacity protein-like surface antigen